MKIKLDENLPGRLVQALTDLGHDVDTVILERLAGHDDHAVWQATQQADPFLITQDLDFSDMRRYTPGTPPWPAAGPPPFPWQNRAVRSYPVTVCRRRCLDVGRLSRRRHRSKTACTAA